MGEFMIFVSKTLAERTNAGTRQSVTEHENVCHVHARADNLVGVVIADKEYPMRVAFGLVGKVFDELSKKYPNKDWSTVNEGELQFSELADLLALYQDPEKADPMSKVQKELDETKVILHDTINSVLERGEKMENLVAKSGDLSAATKAFYGAAADTNSCCVLQ
eukprot:Colp12_sorted_trinity150504_noHs@4156